jgi:hypothetical protein
MRIFIFLRAKNKKAGPKAGLKTSGWQLKAFSLDQFLFLFRSSRCSRISRGCGSGCVSRLGGIGRRSGRGR